MLYFDSYPIIESLPAEQRGWLLSALYTYASRLSRERKLNWMDVIPEFPEMDVTTCTAFGFLSAAIYRDTQKWFGQQEARRRRSEAKNAAKQPVTPALLYNSDEDYYRDTMRMLAQIRAEDAEQERDT